MGKKDKQDELWDDSALINAFNDAVSKYMVIFLASFKTPFVGFVLFLHSSLSVVSVHHHQVEVSFGFLVKILFSTSCYQKRGKITSIWNDFESLPDLKLHAFNWDLFAIHKIVYFILSYSFFLGLNPMVLSR